MTEPGGRGDAAEELERISARFLLGLVLWREARGEPPVARVAVAHSILNRVARPSWWGADVMSVITKKWQFSSMTDPHDPQLTTWPQRADVSWWESLRIACAVLDGKITNPVPGADSYYDLSITAPKWAEARCFVREIGRLRFYNVDQDHEIAALTGAAA